jgi:YYY domain-containing protein
MVKKIIYSIIAVLLIIAGKLMLQGDFIAFLQWWVIIAGLGLIFMPLTTLIFHNYHDKGYLFSKTIGIAISGYLMWLLSSLHILRFTQSSCIISIVISLVINVAILVLQKRIWNKNNVNENKISILSKDFYPKGLLSSIIVEELLFFGIFLLFTYIRGFKPEAYGTEKFMDYGFMTSMMRSDYMPPQDFWFSGTKLNYYYVGQYLATYITKLSFVKVSYGYNLMLMMVGAFAVVLPYSIVYQLTKNIIQEKGKSLRFLPGISGLIAGAGVCIAGNMHYPTFQWFEPMVRKFFGMEASKGKYWFPDATRYIGYHPETNDKTIHEFPAYSFVLGDLHAHVVNILFVLTLLGILVAWLRSRKECKDKCPDTWKEIVNPSFILLGFFIGLFHTTNFWDFPIYYVVSGAVILFSNLIVYNFKSKAIWLTGLQGIFIMVVSEIIALPFTLNFDQISTTPCLAVSHTPLNQLIVLWGLPVYTVLTFLCFMISNFNHNKKEAAEQEQVKKSGWTGFMTALSGSDLFILTIGLCAIGLVLLPELIYIEDIYSGDYKRANTMFKLTYQAFIMFGICFGYIFTRLLAFGETRRQKRVAAVTLLFFAMTLFYVGNAVPAWYGNIFDHKGYKGINAYAFMETKMQEDYHAINWLNENVTGMPVVLEANGDSYTSYQRVSVMTGLPTLLGWHTHEWLWKSNTEILDERAADIQIIYTSNDETEVRALIKKYGISYIYVGKLEQEKYTSVNHTLLKSLGNVVFDSPETENNVFDTYIIEITD